MSRDLFDAVWRKSPARGLDLIVLVAIADATEDAKGPWIDMSIRHLAVRCRACVRAVQGAIRRQEAAGSLMVSGLSGRHGWNRYRIIPPGDDARPKTARPLTPAQLDRCRAGGRAHAALVQRNAPGVQPDAPDTNGYVHPDAPGDCIPMHRDGATGCTGLVHPDAETGATGCTQDSELDREKSVPGERERGGVPPRGQNTERLPPVPPVGGTQAPGRRDLRKLVAERMKADTPALMPADKDPAILNQLPIDWKAGQESAQASGSATHRPHQPTKPHRYEREGD